MASAGNSVGSMPPQRKPVRTLNSPRSSGSAKLGAVFIAAVISGIMRRAAQDEVQRNQVAGIEQMIDARGDFPAVAFEGLAGIVCAAMDFIVTVGKAAAGQAEAKIRVRPQTMDKAEFGIQIHRRHGQPQRQVRAQEIRLVMIIKRVAGERRMAFERLIVAELDQVALDRVNLRETKNGGEQHQPEQRAPESFHRRFRNAKPRRQQARIHSPLDTADILRLTIANLISPMPSLNSELLAKAKSLGFSDRQIAHLTGTTEDKIRAVRKKLGLVPSYRLVDTCAAEFEAYTPYYYSTYDRGDDEVERQRRRKR